MLTENEGFNNKIIMEMSQGVYPETSITTKYGEFKLKYPCGKDDQLIEKRKALQLNGLPLHSFSDNFVYSTHRDITLSIVITEYPKDFPEVWTKTGLDEFPDKEVLDSIFKEFKTFSESVKKDISGESSK